MAYMLSAVRSLYRLRLCPEGLALKMEDLRVGFFLLLFFSVFLGVFSFLVLFTLWGGKGAV